MNHLQTGAARASEEAALEAMRKQIEARARGEALVRDELARRDALRTEVAELESRAGLGRRLAAAIAGSRLWALLAGDRGVGPGDGAEAEGKGAALRRARFHLVRRKRMLEGGTAELGRTRVALLRRLPGWLRSGHRHSRAPRTLAVSPRRARSRDAGTSVVLVGTLPAVLRGSLRVLRSDLALHQLVVAPVRSGHPLGPAVAAASQRATGDIVVVATGELDAGPERIARLVEPLLLDGKLGATAESAPRFEWRNAAPHPTAVDSVGSRAGSNGGGAPQPAGAFVGELVALRRELLEEIRPCAEYRDPLWLTDFSLAVAARGHRLAVVPAAEGGAGTSVLAEAGSSTEDLALLRRRWGPALRRRILTDLIAGGGEWCARPARVLVDPDCPPGTADAVAGLGLAQAKGAADADVAVTVEPAGGLSLQWILVGERSVASAKGLAAGPSRPDESRTLARALNRSVCGPAFCIRIAGRDWESASRGGDAAVGRSLARALGKRGHQALLQVNADTGLAAADCLDVLLVLRGRPAGEPSAGRINLIWQLSHPEETTAAEFNRYDRVLVASMHHAERLRGTVQPIVEPLLQFTDPELFRPASGTGPEHDVAFVGNWRGEFRRIVWDALEAGRPPALYGRGWDLLAPEHAIAEHVPPTELHRLYSSCKVLLCDHWDDMRHLGFVSNRIFDALACEAFVIADDNPGLADVLPGAVETYSTPAELGEKIDRYLGDPAERERIARRGRAAVLGEHTVERRAEQLLAIAAAAARECARPMTAHLRAWQPGQPSGEPAGGASAAAVAPRAMGADGA